MTPENLEETPNFGMHGVHGPMDNGHRQMNRLASLDAEKTYLGVPRTLLLSLFFRFCAVR